MSVEILKRCLLLKDFTPVGLEILARIAKPKVILAGKALFVEGGASESLFIVAEGRFQVMLKNTEGKDIAVAAMGAGEHMGEMGLIAAGRQPLHLCSVVAEADSKVLEISSADFQSLMKEKPQACVKLLFALSAELGRKSAGARDPLRHILARAVTR
jgi:CRP-like cAMP-binding protein